MSEIVQASVNGIPLVLFVMGLVTLSAQFGAKGKVQLAISMLIGLIFGLGYMASTTPMLTFADWFEAAVFGLMLGLVASGLYDTTLKVAGTAGTAYGNAVKKE